VFKSRIEEQELSPVGEENDAVVRIEFQMEVKMKVTTENWKNVIRDMNESGVLNLLHYKNGGLKTVITKNGIRYEFSQKVIRQLIESSAMAVKIGRKVERR
jgi:hypothetical protein